MQIKDVNKIGIKICFKYDLLFVGPFFDSFVSSLSKSSFNIYNKNY